MNIILFIYDFPYSTSPTVIRWGRTLKQLDAEGWKITVITTSLLPPDTHKIELNYSDNIKIIQTKPGALIGLITTLRRNKKAAPELQTNKQKPNLFFTILKFFYNKIFLNLLFPDFAIEWIPIAIKSAKPYIHNCDMIVTISGWPVSPHIIGYFSKIFFKKNWTAIFHDPWAYSPANLIPHWRRWLDKIFEKLLLKRANLIAFTTQQTKDLYIKNYKLNKERTDTIIHGFNEEEFKYITPEKSLRFRIVHTGTLYDDIRNPNHFFKALACLQELPIEVILAGHVPINHLETIKELRLEEKIKYLGNVSYTRSLALQKSADILLLIGNTGQLQLPSKIFEYLAIRRPILVIKTDQNDLAANLVARNNSGLIVANQPEEIVQAIRQIYSYWRNNTLETTFNLNNALNLPKGNFTYILKKHFSNQKTS